MKPKTIRLAMQITVWVVALSAFALSFEGIRNLGIASGYGPYLSSLLPLTLDGLVLCGSLVILDAEMRSLGKRFGWLLVISGVLGSVAANVLAVASSGLTAQLVHAGAPLVLALVLEGWLSTMRGALKQQLEAEAIEAEELAVAEALEAERIAEAEALAQREADRQERAELMARRKTPVSAKQVQDLRATGLTWKQTAAALGVSEHVAQKALKNQSPVEDPSWAREEKAA